jgi:hypothetical protein
MVKSIEGLGCFCDISEDRSLKTDLFDFIEILKKSRIDVSCHYSHGTFRAKNKKGESHVEGEI